MNFSRAFAYAASFAIAVATVSLGEASAQLPVPQLFETEPRLALLTPDSDTTTTSCKATKCDPKTPCPASSKCNEEVICEEISVENHLELRHGIRRAVPIHERAAEIMFKLPPGTILTVNGRDYFGVGTLCIVKTTIPTREPRRYFYSARDNNGKDLTSRLVEGNAKFGKNGLGFSFVDMRPKCYAVIEFEPETVAQAPVQIQAIQAPEDSERMAELPSVFHFRNTDIRIHEVGANLPFDYQGLPPTLEFASKTIPDELANRTIVKATLTLTIERTGHATDARVVDLCHDVPIELHPEANILIGRVDLANLVGTAFDNYLNDEFRAHVDPKAYNYEINGVLALQDVAGNKTVLSKLANQIRVRVTK